MTSETTGGSEDPIEAFWRDQGSRPNLRRDPGETPSQRRFQAIYEIIRERITLLAFPPGTVLDIDALAAEFDVSRTPIRSVLQQLAYHGLVVSRHGVRTSVAPIDFEKLREALAFRSHLAELIGVLTPLEPDPLALAALRRAKADCAALIDKPDLENFARIDIAAHEAICSLIGNRELLQTYDNLYYRTARSWYYFLPRLDWRDEVSIFFHDIASRVDALERGDVKAIGFITRNAVSAVLIRLDSLIGFLERAHDPGEPSLPS